MGQTIEWAGGSKKDAPRSWRCQTPAAECGQPSDSVMWQAAGRLCVVLCSGWRRHGPELCPGPRGAALLWACPQQARSSSAPYPLEGPVRGLCPGPGSGKRRARQLRRSTRLRADSAGPGAGRNPTLSRHEGRTFEPTMLARCCLSRRWPGPANSSASAADTAACQIPTRYPPCGAVGLPALARPGEGKNQGAPSGRRLPPEGGLAWS
jgi:hypothetical protein